MTAFGGSGLTLTTSRGSNGESI
ncbi:putative sulfite oxidase mitochondrial [Bienertia sinuspersici]